jgi:3'-phosphoadenosine 5'-phosphosulfate sulfotransferase (PAPS reductase)/FAD synthetase
MSSDDDGYGHLGFFIKRKSPETIIAEALSLKPVAIYVGFSGGDDSLTTAHWMMNNVDNCKVLHINTGIGIERTREFVRETCHKYKWPLTEMRAKEDCGQDYDKEVLAHGFPGPYQHIKMYNLLKQKCIDKLVRESKKNHKDKVMIVTGIRYDESTKRMRYVHEQVENRGAQIWVKPLYWWSKSQFMDYIKANKLERNPVSVLLGMSGECCCGAYAHKGMKEMIRIVDPITASRIDRLEKEVRAAGFPWGFEESAAMVDPENRQGKRNTYGFLMPMCVGCEKRGLD